MFTTERLASQSWAIPRHLYSHSGNFDWPCPFLFKQSIEILRSELPLLAAAMGQIILSQSTCRSQAQVPAVGCCQSHGQYGSVLVAEICWLLWRRVGKVYTEPP
jgi:hypothetical protein